MQSRDDLHKLIDSLPDGAFEAARIALNNFQVWPPAKPDLLDLRKRMDEHQQRVEQLGK